MTDLSHQATVAAPAARDGLRSAAMSPLLPYVCVFVAGATGLAAGRAMGGDSADFESKLLLLLRFMAAMKFAGVIAAAAVLHWRLRQPIGRGLAWTYIGALTLMALAPGLIWSLGGIAPGALLFHVGLLGFLYLAWRDEGAQLPRRR